MQPNHNYESSAWLPSVGHALVRWHVELALLSLILASYFVSESMIPWKSAPELAGIVILVACLGGLMVEPVRTKISRWLYRSRHARRLYRCIERSGSPLARRLPRVLRAEALPQGIGLTLLLKKGSTPSELERILPNLTVDYRAFAVRMSAVVGDGSKFLLTIHLRSPFTAAPIPWPHDGDTSTSVLAGLPLGVDESGKPVEIRLAQRNLLIGGEPGAGKSGAVSVILAAAVLDPTCQVFIIDGKSPELARWRSVVNGYVGSQIIEAQAMLENLQRMAEDRFLRLAPDQDGIEYRATPVVIIIEELPYYLSDPDRKAVARFTATLRDIISRSRVAGFIVITTAQKPSADTVPTSIRDLITLRLAYRCSTRDASDTILGAWSSAGASASTIPMRDRGVAFLLDDGEFPRKIKTYWIDPQRVRELTSGAPQSPPFRGDHE